MLAIITTSACICILITRLFPWSGVLSFPILLDVPFRRISLGIHAYHRSLRSASHAAGALRGRGGSERRWRLKRWENREFISFLWKSRIETKLEDETQVQEATPVKLGERPAPQEALQEASGFSRVRTDDAPMRTGYALHLPALGRSHETSSGLNTSTENALLDTGSVAVTERSSHALESQISDDVYEKNGTERTTASAIASHQLETVSQPVLSRHLDSATATEDVQDGILDISGQQCGV
jgi:hypothetical protein